MPTLPLPTSTPTPTSTSTSTSISLSTPTAPVDLAVSYITPLPCCLLTSSWCSCKLTLQDARFGIKQSRKTFSIKTTVSATVTLFAHPIACSRPLRARCYYPLRAARICYPFHVTRQSHITVVSCLRYFAPCYYLSTSLPLTPHRYCSLRAAYLCRLYRIALSVSCWWSLTSRRLITHPRALFLQHHFVLLCAHILWPASQALSTRRILCLTNSGCHFFHCFP